MRTNFITQDDSYTAGYEINSTPSTSDETVAFEKTAMAFPTSSLEQSENRLRARRIRKSPLLKLNLDGIESPSIIIAQSLDDYKQSFNLVHNEYVNCGYLQPKPQHPYHYSKHSFLPGTRVFAFKSANTVVATLTEILDSTDIGLPMDELYKNEVDSLRNQGRTVAELSAFVTSRSFRMRNIMVYLCKAMFNHSRATKVDDICIMVNPKHVAFYTKMFLFEPFGPERFFEKVHAPAVPLRIDMRHIIHRLQETYAQGVCEEDLCSFFCNTNTTLEMLLAGSNRREPRHTPQDVMAFFRHPNALAMAA